MGQLLISVAPHCQLGLCPIGNLDFAAIRSRFELQESHQLLHSFVGGLIEPVQQWGENGNLSLEEALQRFLQTKLPAYMVPGSFQLLETLPLTVNGKVDRKALPEPRPSTPPTAPTISAPDQAQRKGVPIVSRSPGLSPTCCTWPRLSQTQIF